MTTIKFISKGAKFTECITALIKSESEYGYDALFLNIRTSLKMCSSLKIAVSSNHRTEFSKALIAVFDWGSSVTVGINVISSVRVRFIDMVR